MALAAALAAAEPAGARDPWPDQPLLPEVVVTATRVETPRREVGSAITVITAEDIERRQARLVSEVLRQVPGLAVSRGGGVGALTQVRLRGAEANQTLVLIDGIEVNDPSAASEFDFANLLAADVERIEILRGPQSALYGSDAVGGVINIITKRGRGRPALTARLEAGSFATRQATVAVRAGGPRSHLAVTGNVFRTNGVSAASEDRGNDEQDGYRNRTVSAKAGLRVLDNLELDLVGRWMEGEVQTDGFMGGVGAVDDDSETDSRERFGRVQARLDLFRGRWEHILAASVAEHERDNRTGGVSNSQFDGFKTKYEYQTNAYLDTAWLADARHTLTFAVESETEEVFAQSAFTDVDREIDSTGVVGQYALGLWDRLFLTGSVRRDGNDLFESATTHRVTAAYVHPETGTKLKGSTGTGVKNPTIFELFGFAATFQGNPNLKPEEGTGWDAGLEQSFLGGRIEGEAVYFENRVDNLIVGAGQTAVNLPGESRARGVEVSLRARVTEGVDLAGAYTFTSTRDADGNELVRRPKHMASLTLNGRFLEDRANLNLGVDYVGTRKDIAFDAFFNQTPVVLDDYVLVRLAGSYRVTQSIEIIARVENLLDQDYEEAFTFGAPGIAAYVGVAVRM